MPRINSLNNVIDMAVGSDGAVWAVTGDHKVYEFRPGQDSSWTQIPGEMAQVSMGRAGSAWGLDPKGALHRYLSSSRSWDLLAGGPFVSVASASENEAWGVDQLGGVFSFSSDGEITPVPGKLVSIAVGGGVWGLSDKDDIFRLSGDRKVWTQIPGKLRQITVGADGGVMGVTAKGNVFSLASNNSWIQLHLHARKVFRGNGSNIWLIDPKGNTAWMLSDQIASAPDSGDEQWRPAAGKRWDSKDKYDQTKSTHLWLVSRAAEVARPVPVLGQRIYDLVAPNIKGKGTSRFHDALCEGLWDADAADPYRNSLLEGDAWYDTLSATYKSHFYDPSTGKNWWGETSPTALTEGKKFFYQSASQYKLGNLSAAGYNLGLALHYLTDMTQPMHSTNFTVLSSTPIGFHSAFETIAIQVMKQVQIRAAYQRPKSADPADILIATAKKSAARASKVTNGDMLLAWYNYMSYGDDQWSEPAAKQIKEALVDGVAFTAQFLISWMDAAKQTVPDSDPRIFTEIHETSHRTWWGLHKDGHLMFRNGYGSAWTLMNQPDSSEPVTHLQVDASDMVYAVAGKKVWLLGPEQHWRAVYPPRIPDDDSGMADVVQLVVVAPARQWALDSNARVFQGEGVLPAVGWESTDSPILTAISATSFDTCWGVNAADSSAWQYTGEKWVSRGSGVVKTLSVDSQGRPWGISPNGRVVTFDGQSWTNPPDFDSDLVSDSATPDWGSLEWISVERSTLVIDSDGVPWGPAVLAANENPWMPLA